MINYFKLLEIPDNIIEGMKKEDKILKSLSVLHNYMIYIFDKLDDLIDEEEIEEDDCVLLEIKDCEFLRFCLENIKQKLKESNPHENIYNKSKEAIKALYLDKIEKALIEAYARANEEEEEGNKITYTPEQFADIVENILVAGLAIINLSFYVGYKKNYYLSFEEDLDNPDFWNNQHIQRVVDNTIFTDYL